jgi:hypothetical protein
VRLVDDPAVGLRREIGDLADRRRHDPVDERVQLRVVHIARVVVVRPLDRVPVDRSTGTRSSGRTTTTRAM